MNSTAASLNSKPPRSTDAAAELRALKVEKLRRLQLRAESLGDFIPRVSPGMVRPDHLAPVLALFERIARGERVRACVSIPSQHGKSQTVLHALAWLLLRRPTWPLIYLTYQQEQSDDQSHKARGIARAAGVDLAADRANPVRQLVMAPTGDRIALARERGGVEVHALPELRRLGTIAAANVRDIRLFADGSVRFVKNTVDLATWRALGTVAGGEVISADAY